jgi:NAD(P)-dependent dehydrogenase (short-subunit alcohol dehydrogenase family)
VERVALVSGANRGLGRETARQLADQRLRVIVGSRDLAAGEAEAAAMGPRATARRLDVTEQATVDDLFAWIRDELGRLDVLVNNAGIGGDHLPGGVEANLEGVKNVLETNLFGAWRLAEAAVPLMRENGYGRIVNVSSGMGQLSDMGGGNPGYRVSKTSLNAMTRILAAELAGENILVNSVCPGWVRTDMGGQNARRSVEEGADGIVWLATLPDGGPSGDFFRDRKPIPW